MFSSDLTHTARRSAMLVVAVAVAAATAAAPLAQAKAGQNARQPDRALASAIAQVKAASGCVVGATYVRDVDPFSGLVNDHVRFVLSRGGTRTQVSAVTSFVNVPVSSFLVQENLPGGVVLRLPAFTAPGAIVAAACASLTASVGG